MVVLNNGTAMNIVEYMENSLNRHSNRSLAEIVLLSFGMSLYTVLGVLGESADHANSIGFFARGTAQMETVEYFITTLLIFRLSNHENTLTKTSSSRKRVGARGPDYPAKMGWTGLGHADLHLQPHHV
jgi:hypothetical protein